MIDVSWGRLIITDDKGILEKGGTVPMNCLGLKSWIYYIKYDRKKN